MGNLAAALVLAAVSSTPNLDLADGNHRHWEGQGFEVVALPQKPTSFAFSSQPKPLGTRLAHRTIQVPPNAKYLYCQAAVYLPGGSPGRPAVDVIVEGPNRVYLSREGRGDKGWLPSSEIHHSKEPDLKEYRWNVSAFAGKPIRIALFDQDPRPDCYLLCTGFHLLGADEENIREFAEYMVSLSTKHRLNPMNRMDSRHFVAISNTIGDFTEERLYHCETIYGLFFDHFRKNGFNVKEPTDKLMVAIFDSQAGFEAYVGSTMSNVVTGIYHRGTNRLVVYDMATNRALLEAKEKGQREAGSVTGLLQRQRVLASIHRQVRQHREDANISTIMHEVAHQLSFNGGLLNRGGDVPGWLAEGLATYCESTIDGSWQGLGESNPQRAAALAAKGGRGDYLSLQRLIADERWLREAKTSQELLRGYAQSWALFRMLMEERKSALRDYLATIALRRTPDHRLADFVKAFGSLQEMELRYHEYIRQVVEEQARKAKR